MQRRIIPDMRSSLPLLSVCLLLSTSAGASVQTLATATGVGSGNTSASLELGAGLSAAGNSVGPTAGEVSLTWGLTDRDDVTARFGLVSGAEFGMKRSFRFAALPGFALATDARVGLHFASAGAVPLLNGNLGVIAEWSPLASLHVLASPRLLLSSSPVAPWTSGIRLESTAGPQEVQSVNTHLALAPVCTLGLAVDVHPSVRLLAEAGWVFAPILQTQNRSFEPLQGVSAAFAIQWRSQDLGAR